MTSDSDRSTDANGDGDIDVDIAIIGGGPTGMTAGLYAARALRKTVMWERSVIGGQIANTGTVENYPGFPEGINGFDLAMAMHAQAERFGMETKYEDVTTLRREPPYFVIDAPSGRYRDEDERSRFWRARKGA